MSKKRILVSGAIALALLVLVGSIIFGVNRAANSPERLISLGEKYLLEMNYEQALVQFLKVIEIDPMNPRGYTGAAEAYIGLGRTDEAIAVLQQGFEMTDDMTIRGMLDELLNESEQPNEDKSSDDSDVHSEDGVKNLSGADPFVVKDLEDWGFPIGVTIYDVQGRLGISADDINTELSRAREFKQWEIANGFTPTWYDCQLSIGEIVDDVFNGFYIILDDTTGQIKGIRMDSYSEVLPDGPRGIRVGMTIKEVINRFMVLNADALSFSDSLDYGLFTSDDGNISIYNTNTREVYSGHFMQFASIGKWWKGMEDERELGGAAVFYNYQQNENTHAIYLTLYFSIGGILTNYSLEINEVIQSEQMNSSSIPETSTTIPPADESIQAPVPSSSQTATPAIGTIIIAGQEIKMDVTTLDLSGKNLTDISALANLTQLHWLNLENNQIEDISPLSELKKLKSLWLGKNKLTDITPLVGLTKMEGLGIQNNLIVDISPIAEMTDLAQLWLSDNSITDISSLSGLTNLIALHLNGNSVTDLSPVSHVEYVDIRP